MKKLVCIGLISAVAVSTVACGRNNKNTQVTQSEQEIVELNAQVTENNPNEENQNREEEIPDKKIEEEKLTNKEENKEGKKKEETNVDKENSAKSEETIKSEVSKVKDEKSKEEKPNNNNQSSNKKPESNQNEDKKQDQTKRSFKLTYLNTLGQSDELLSDMDITTVGLDVAENIKEILKTISGRYFGGNSLVLSRIDNVAGKKIAVIDLASNDSYWYNSMQGGAGGRATEHALIENILQRSYSGYWVDGVKFTLGGQEIPESDHAPKLSKINYR